MKPIDPKEKLRSFKAHWHPHRIAEVNDMQVLLAKVSDQFIWHAHPDEDELFQVLKGTLYMEFRDRTETVPEGQLIVVPKGVEHRPFTLNGEEVHLLLFEPLSTAHTGDTKSERTQTHYPSI